MRKYLVIFIFFGVVVMIPGLWDTQPPRIQAQVVQGTPVAKPRPKEEPGYDPRVPSKEKESKKTKKKDEDAPPPVQQKSSGTPSGNNIATLPISLVRNRLENMKDGSKGYIAVVDLKVDGLRQVWLHPHALVGSKSEDKPLVVSKEGGSYSIVIPGGTQHLWDALDFEPGNTKWIPVKNLSTNDK